MTRLQGGLCQACSSGVRPSVRPSVGPSAGPALVGGGEVGQSSPPPYMSASFLNRGPQSFR